MSPLTEIIRVYPIRTSKKKWKIPLHCYHNCSTECATMYVRDTSNPDTFRFMLVNNPNYINNKCPDFGKLEKTLIHLSMFDMDDPIGITGPLYEPNLIVIPDKDFSITITYPLLHSVSVNINKSTSNGFTLSNILHIVKMLYHYIYQEEERTATPISYNVKKECNSCDNNRYINCLTPYIPELNEECSICYNIYDKNESSGKLKCGHFYHTRCILKWLKTSVTCPLCRCNVIECDECDGSGIIQHTYSNIVIPIIHRGSVLNRNNTDGIYGIFGHDLEDLIISNMYYNRIKRQLTLNIGS